MARASFKFVDYDKESSTVSVHTANLTAGNFAAQEALRDTLEAAIEAVVLGPRQKTTASAFEESIGVTQATNPFAQRETKWHIRMIDPNGNPVSVELPTANLALLATNSKNMDPDSTEYTNLAAAIEAYVLSNDLEAVQVVEIVHVGRNY